MNMQKTPVSMLQEMMQKKGGTPPHYDLILDGGGTHLNTFTYKVTCGDLSATGTGRTKKDAKHEAASAMLTKMAQHNALPQLPASPHETPVRTPLPMEIPNCPKSPANVGFTNSVGELQDLCANNNLDDPKYEIVGDIGPAHARIFTIKCIVSTFSAEGTALTKKQAKHEAARKVIERLKDVISEDLVILTANEKEITLEEISKNKALLKYPELSKTVEVKSKTNWSLKVTDYHKSFKNTFEEFGNLELIVTKLQELNDLISFYKKNFSQENLNAVRLELEDILSPLDIKFNLCEYPAINESVFIIGIQITTCPELHEIVIAKNASKAEFEAISLVVNSLIFFIL